MRYGTTHHADPFTNRTPNVILYSIRKREGRSIMTNDNTVPADGYYSEEAPSEEFDLSFLNDDEPTKKA